MIRKSVTLLMLMILLAGASIAYAQDDDTGDDDTTTEDTAPTSTVDIFGVLCEDRIVLTISGVMQSGYDIYYQVFSQAGGGGTPLTGLRRVQVDGAYSVSDVTTYTGGTLPFSNVGSFYAAIGREGDAESTLWNNFIDDIQDGCAEPTAPAATTVDSDGTVTGPDTTVTSTGATRSGRAIADGVFVDTGTSAILSPFGGFLNDGYVPPDKPLVEVGPRDQFENPRQVVPGLVFAECEDYLVAEPGIIYDRDNTIVFWSWFTATEEQMIDHINTVDYSVTYYQTLPLPNPIRTEIQEIDGLYWVFYYSVLGNLRPARYFIEYKVTWDDVHFDGFSEYGPGTDNDTLVSGCEFVVLPNPEGEPVNTARWPFYD